MLHGSALDVHGQAHMTHDAHYDVYYDIPQHIMAFITPYYFVPFYLTNGPSTPTNMHQYSNTPANHAPPLQRLFVGLQPSKQTTEIGVIDLRKVGQVMYPLGR